MNSTTEQPDPDHTVDPSWWNHATSFTAMPLEGKDFSDYRLSLKIQAYAGIFIVITGVIGKESNSNLLCYVNMINCHFGPSTNH